MGFLPFNTLPTHSVPLVSDLPEEVVQFLGVSWQCSFVSHGLPRAHCGVIYWLLRTKSLLKLLQ